MEYLHSVCFTRFSIKINSACVVENLCCYKEDKVEKLWQLYFYATTWLIFAGPVTNSKADYPTMRKQSSYVHA